MTAPVKRSVSIGGHRTSLTVEDAFWDAFRALCRAEGRAVSAVLADIDRARQGGLSGAVRLWVLARLRARAGL